MGSDMLRRALVNAFQMRTGCRNTEKHSIGSMQLQTQQLYKLMEQLLC